MSEFQALKDRVQMHVSQTGQRCPVLWLDSTDPEGGAYGQLVVWKDEKDQLWMAYGDLRVQVSREEAVSLLVDPLLAGYNVLGIILTFQEAMDRVYKVWARYAEQLRQALEGGQPKPRYKALYGYVGQKHRGPKRGFRNRYTLTTWQESTTTTLWVASFYDRGSLTQDPYRGPVVYATSRFSQEQAIELARKNLRARKKN